MVTELMNTLIQNKISPNQYYLLICISTGVSPLYINIQMELRLLRSEWVDSNNKLTQKAIDLIDSIDNTYTVKRKKQIKQILGDNAEWNIITYRELFPKGKLPSGVSARATVQELEKKFTWFFNTYKSKYSWDLIIEVTTKYIAEFEANNFLYMKNSSYFLSKQDKGGILISELDTQCEDYLEADEEVVYNPKIIRKSN